jgi:hypothetical protein
LSRRARIVVVLVLLAATALLAVAPRPLSSPIRKLANYKANGADPIWDSRPPVDGAAFRRAAKIVPPKAYIYVYGPGGQYQHDLLGATLLYFAPVFPVAYPRQAKWVLSYQEPSLVPPGVRAVQRWEVGDHVYIVRVEPT